jgi:hypothetical protein
VMLLACQKPRVDPRWPNLPVRPDICVQVVIWGSKDLTSMRLPD